MSIRPSSLVLSFGVIVSMFLASCGGAPVDPTHLVEIFYLPHPPAVAIVTKVDPILAKYSQFTVHKCIFGDQSCQPLVDKYGLHEHMPIAIFIGGTDTFTVGGKNVQLRNFPAGDAFVPSFEGGWSYDGPRQDSPIDPLNRMLAFVARNLLFHWRKVLVTVLLVSVVLTVGLGSMAFAEHVRNLADRPLTSLGTELVLQEDQTDQNPGAIRTRGVILPFNLQSFSRKDVRSKLQDIPGVSGVSTALLLWQFDPQNNRTVVGLDITDPPIGLRKIDTLLMTGGHFFSSNDAQEIILERHYATLFGYKVGQTFILGDVRYPIIGLVDFHEQSNLSNAQAFLPYDTALSLVHGQSDIANQTFVALKSASDLPSVQKAVLEHLPSFSVITKDDLVKNLSALNQLFYHFGSLFVIAVAVLCLLLIVWIIRLHQMEFSSQRTTLRTIGWSRGSIRQWMAIEIVVILVLACILALLFTAVLQWGMDAAMMPPPLLNTHL